MEKNILACSCVVLIISLSTVCSKFLPNSPCPSTFEYAHQGDQVIGMIQLTGDRPVAELVINVNFTIASKLYSNFPGSLDPVDENSLIEKYNRGYPVQYRVTFPVSSLVPKLTALTVNGQTICHGTEEPSVRDETTLSARPVVRRRRRQSFFDFPRPNQYVSKISLQHTSNSGSSIFNSRPHQFSSFSEFPDSHGDWHEIFDGGTQFYSFKNTNVPDQISKVTKIQQSVSSQGQISKVTKIQHSLSSQGVLTDNDDPFKTKIQSLFSTVNDEPFKTKIQSLFSTVNDDPFKTKIQSLFDEERARAPTTTRAPVTQRQQSSSAGNNECGVTDADESIPLIYGGNSYIRGDLPWLVAIYRRNGGNPTFICGGSLVSKRHIVTAAHCLWPPRSKKTPIEEFVLRIGVHNLDNWSDDITALRMVSKAHLHENYNSSSLEDDILVFTLDKDVPYNKYIRPVCLWSGNTDLSRIVGATGNVAGWGEQAGKTTGAGEPSMVRMPIVSRNVCLATKSQHLAFINTLCAGGRDGTGPCVGDSGGGMYLIDSGKWRLRGIVSSSLRSKNSDRTCDLNEFIVFTDTAQYLPWIKNILNENTFD